MRRPDKDGSNRRDNITDWAPEQFRTHYGDQKIAKWDIFYCVYGLLRHPGYRTKFADNLKRELPRIPFAPAVLVGAASRAAPEPSDGAVPRAKSKGQKANAASRGGRDAAGGASVPLGSRDLQASGFWAFADAGKELARLHLDYEKLEPYELKFIETSGVPLSYRVEDKMRLSKDKTSLKVNPSLIVAGIFPLLCQSISKRLHLVPRAAANHHAQLAGSAQPAPERVAGWRRHDAALD